MDHSALQAATNVKSRSYTILCGGISWFGVVDADEGVRRMVKKGVDRVGPGDFHP